MFRLNKEGGPSRQPKLRAIDHYSRIITILARIDHSPVFDSAVIGTQIDEHIIAIAHSSRRQKRQVQKALCNLREKGAAIASAMPASLDVALQPKNPRRFRNV